MNYYVTKYALTDGIWIVAESKVKVVDRYLYISSGRGLAVQVPRGYWFTSLEKAQAHVAVQVEKKLKSLEKAVQKFKEYQPAIKRV